jgi:hypothetical protein
LCFTGSTSCRGWLEWLCKRSSWFAGDSGWWLRQKSYFAVYCSITSIITKDGKIRFHNFKRASQCCILQPAEQLYPMPNPTWSFELC